MKKGGRNAWYTAGYTCTSGYSACYAAGECRQQSFAWLRRSSGSCRRRLPSRSCRRASAGFLAGFLASFAAGFAAGFALGFALGFAFGFALGFGLGFPVFVNFVKFLDWFILKD